MENMKKVAKVLEMVRKTSSTNAKQAILQRENEQEYGETLRNVLSYTYNPFMMFGLTDKTLQVVRPDIMTYARATEKDFSSSVNDADHKLKDSLLRPTRIIKSEIISCSFSVKAVKSSS